jgi:hypothetical protein
MYIIYNQTYTEFPSFSEEKRVYLLLKCDTVNPSSQTFKIPIIAWE